jgi:hypothetical protein
MRSKNSKSITTREHEHMGAVKRLPCSVCDAPAPSDAHHINQGQHFTVVALCKSCHQGPLLGLHGAKGMWRLKKMDEISALAKTIERVLA